MRKNKFLIALVGVAILMGAMSQTTLARNIDTYRELLRKQTYTIRYENITPRKRRTNKDVTVMMYGMGLSDAVNSVTNRQYKGVIVANGPDRYSEILHDESFVRSGFRLGGFGLLGMIADAADASDGPKKKIVETGACTLMRDGERFTFSKTVDGEKVKYGDFSQGEKEVKNMPSKRIDNGRNAYLAKLSTSDTGDGEINFLLAAIMPTAESGMPEYKFVDSGWIGNINFEDYSAEKDGVFYAIRYYFENYALKKIAAASYVKKADGSIENYNKYIVRITEFSPVPNAECLALPPELAKKVKNRGKQGSEN